ncbi:cytochrome P450 [Heliocybe sulcata]|uniref:Cytochrome P450 n=1 Tax=Heliocybe sulcata TaxID=5364 RepID=A0A5C3MWV9_9AGAM|nr:cytochrome P450 [Heliocybe sulcata]
MVASLLRVVIYAIIAGVSSHAVIKRSEPSALTVLLAVVCYLVVSIVALCHTKGFGMLDASKYTVCVLAAYLASLVATVIVYRLSPWHPLAQYSGPRPAKITKWWMAFWIARGNRHLKLRELHEIYGPWVRIGPNELSVNAPEAVKPIYGQIFRAPFYQGAPQDANALVTTLNREEYSQRLIAWHKAFNSEMLHTYQEFAAARTDQLVQILKREGAGGKRVSLSHWISLWAMDVMGDMAFSGGFETMVAGKDKEGWMEVLSIGVRFVGILGQVPWMRDIVALLPQPGPIVTFQKFASKKVKETKGNMIGTSKDILGIIQEQSSGEPLLSPQEATADASFMIVAGSDTIAQALIALFRYIIGNEDAQKRLCAELNELADGQAGNADAPTLARLPYLDACVQEALRMVPPVPAGPPRYTGDRGYDILGRFIPPYTTLACPIFALHRDPMNFRNPDKFMPERWLPDSSIQPHIKEGFIPFSCGIGICIGKQVALQNMKVFTAILLHHFKLSLAKGFDLDKFDASYKEHNLWRHDSLDVLLSA